MQHMLQVRIARSVGVSESTVALVEYASTSRVRSTRADFACVWLLISLPVRVCEGVVATASQVATG
jgi:hypothetical protein